MIPDAAGTSAAFIVDPSTATHLVIVMKGQTQTNGLGVTGTPDPWTAGIASTATVLAVDDNNNQVQNTARNYIYVTSDDPFAVGYSSFSMISNPDPAIGGRVDISTFVFRTARTSVLTARDTAAGPNNLNSVNSAAITVNPNEPVNIQLVLPGELAVPGSQALTRGVTGAPSPRTAGANFPVTVNIVDGFWNVTTATSVVKIETSEQRLAQAMQGIFVFKLFMGAITGISLLVGGIGIMNVLLASVTERTREIGVRKAAGARRADIVMQFLVESVVISGVGSLVGAALGLTTSFALVALIRARAKAVLLDATFSWSTVLLAAVAALTVGLVFGTYPARRAGKLSPIDAIRHE